MATLKEIRKLCGMTQKELAEKSGVNVRQIQKYESGECVIENMSAKNASAIASALGVTVEELISITPSIFTFEMAAAIKDGNMTVSDAVAISKYEKIRRISKIGSCYDTFCRNYDRIPDQLKNKLPAEDLAELVDAFYFCYSDGKNA